MEKKPSEEIIIKSRKVFNVDKLICNFIRDEFLDESTNRFVGDNMNKSEFILRKVKNEYGYNIPLSTVNAFCVSKKISLSYFFKIFEEKYGSTIEDSYEIIKEEKKIRKKDA